MVETRPGFHDRLLEHVEELYLFAGPGIGRERLREAGGIFRAGVKARLCHLQRDKDALLEEGAKRLAADDFDEAAENVGRTAVVPLRAGLADQRKACNECGVFGIAELAAAHARLLIKLLHQSVAGVLVGDAGRVPQQILDRDRPLQGHEIEPAVVLDADLLVGKFRDEFGDRLVEQEMTFLEQHHDAH